MSTYSKSRDFLEEAILLPAIRSKVREETFDDFGGGSRHYSYSFDFNGGEIHVEFDVSVRADVFTVPSSDRDVPGDVEVEDIHVKVPFISICFEKDGVEHFYEPTLLPLELAEYIEMIVKEE